MPLILMWSDENKAMCHLRNLLKASWTSSLLQFICSKQ